MVMISSHDDDALRLDVSLPGDERLPLDVERRPRLSVLVERRKLGVERLPFRLLGPERGADIAQLLRPAGGGGRLVEVGVPSRLVLELLPACSEVGLDRAGGLLLRLALVRADRGLQLVLPRKETKMMRKRASAG